MTKGVTEYAATARFTRAGLNPALGLVLLTLLAFGNSFPGIFVQDDFQLVLYNPLLQRFDLVQILTTDYWGVSQNSGLFRPLTILSLGLNRMITGAAPWGYHIVNVLLHVAVVLVGYRVLLGWGMPRNVAWMSAAIFAVHPVHSEVVNVVVGRSELLAALFLLLAFLAAKRNDKEGGALAAGAFLLALLAKEHSLVFVVLLPVCDAWRARDLRELRERVFLYGLLVAVLFFWLAWRHWGVDHRNAQQFTAFAETNPLAYLPAVDRILTALDLQFHYLLILLHPYSLQISYYGVDFHAPLSGLWSTPGGMVVVGTVAVLVLMCAGLRRRFDVAMFSLLYLLSFSVTANILLPVGVAFAERLVYFPSFWFCAGIASLASITGLGSFFRTGVWSILICFLCLLLVLNIGRNRDFDDPVTLWTKEVSRGEHDVFAWMNLAVNLAAAGRATEAEQIYQRLSQVDPPSPAALRSFAIFLIGQGRLREALVPAREVLELAREQKDEGGERLALVMLGDIAVQLRDYMLALDYLGQPAVLRQESHGLSRYLRGCAFAGMGRLQEARELLEASVPSLETPEAWVTLARVLHGLRDRRGAEEALMHACELAPDNLLYQEELQRLRQGKWG